MAFDNKEHPCNQEPTTKSNLAQRTRGHGGLTPEAIRFGCVNGRLTLTRLAAGRSLRDLSCSAPAWTHEASLFVQSCLPARARLRLLLRQSTIRLRHAEIPSHLYKPATQRSAAGEVPWERYLGADGCTLIVPFLPSPRQSRLMPALRAIGSTLVREGLFSPCSAYPEGYNLAYGWTINKAIRLFDHFIHCRKPLGF